MIQLQMLNHVLEHKDSSIFLLNSIDSSFFSDYKKEYEFIKSHLDTYGAIPDKITFAGKFPQFDFIEVRESSKYLVEELYSDKNKRSLASIFNRVRELINDGKTEEAMTLYTSAASEVLKATHLECVDILRDTSRYDAYVERSRDFGKYYISTGFTELDEVIGGWDRLEENATIVARPGVGKSWILLKCAIAAVEQGLNVGLYSGEMSELKVGYRADTLIGHVSNSSIIRGRAEVQNTYKQYIDTLPNRFRGSLKVITPKMLGHSATVTDLRAFIEKENLDILCIDQHSLMEDERNAKDPVTRAANISKGIKNLQVLKQIPIISVSQQNREVVADTIDVSHIAQSDRIGQDSTVVIFLEQKEGVMTLHLSKARDSSGTSKLKYAIDLDKGVFSFLPNEEDALRGSSCSDLRNEYEGEYSYGEEPF